MLSQWKRIGLPSAFAMVLMAIFAYGESPRKVNISSLDDVIPQLVVGGGWSTSITLVNIDEGAVSVPIKYFDGNGQPWVPRGLPTAPINIPAKGTVTINTAEDGDLQQGWAQLDFPCCPDVSGYAIFKQRVAGRPDLEAVVPLADSYSQRSVLMFDNTNGYSTGIALVNTDSFTTATVTVAIRDEAGQRIHLDQFTMPKQSKQVFSMPDRFAPSTGRRGSIEFTASPGRISVLGLRFNPGGAFTSIHALEP